MSERGVETEEMAENGGETDLDEREENDEEDDIEDVDEVVKAMMLSFVDTKR